MDFHQHILSQYQASLAMFNSAIAASDETIWNDPTHKNRFWHIAYHSLFYTSLYLSQDEKHFHEWEKHRDEYQFFGPLPWPPHDMPKIGEPYTKADIMEYSEKLGSVLEQRVKEIDLAAPSGFFWLEFNKFELQFYNIRHLHQHTGQLFDRVRTGIPDAKLDWVAMVRG